MRWQTRLLHSGASVRPGFQTLSTPIQRGSTVVFEKQGDVFDDWRAESGYCYGLYGSPTSLELGQRIAELEGAHSTFIVPGGQAAIALVYLAFCKTGSHVLLPHSAYGPSREMAEGLLRDLGITVEGYDPLIGGGIEELIRPETSLIWCESPGSVTMEVQDIPAIVAVADRHDIRIAVDNTWSAGVLFEAFRHGACVTVQALTKYVGGHSDLLLGSISVATPGLYERVGEAWRQFGMSVSPDECSLALRGLQTLAVRLQRHEESAVAIAEWLAARREVAEVRHPALKSCPGHEVWKRDFSGSSGVFSIVFDERVPAQAVVNFVDALSLFKIGLSWGGTTSLAVVYPTLVRPDRDFGGRLVRFSIGLEEPLDLIADLEGAFAQLSPL